jgi:CheY-like chemotaxis protein
MSIMDNSDKNADKDDFVRTFLEANDILIVDSVSSARVILTVLLAQLGAKRSRMALVGTMEEARSEIKRLKPKIIFCDFMIGQESGLDLIQAQKDAHGEKVKDCLFVLVTNNGSQSAIAQAAEEDVDTFVLKPYTAKSFQEALSEAIKNKTQPSDYFRVIAKGKEYLSQGVIDQAIEQFSRAKSLNEKPSLACFYLGQADLLRKEIINAGDDYRQGLIYNKIHYKCLVGLFDVLLGQKKYVEAYDVVKKLAQYFPANPTRLASVLRLAVMTNNYEDIDSYYEIFTQFESRSDELVRYVCSALAVSGKYFLTRKTQRRALESFNKIAASCAGRIQYMRYAVEAMIEFDCHDEASQYLERFPPDLRASPDYLVSSLLIAGATRQSGEVIQLARNLINQGIEQAGVYQLLIQHSAKSGLDDSAEELVHSARIKWPLQAGLFSESLIKGHSERASKSAGS